MNVYEIVTDRVLNDLKAGTVPWAKPWIGGKPRNWVSGKEYRGVNLLLLPGGEYVSFKQAIAAGGTVPKGTKSYMAVFFKPIDRKEATDNSPAKKGGMILRYYNVFRIADVGLKSKRTATEHNPIAEAETIVNSYVSNGPSLVHDHSDRACYSPDQDIVSMPNREQFPLLDRYYSTLFHELVHSTGHTSRLDRFNSESGSYSFNQDSYSKEELVAELGAAMLCATLEIDTSDLQQQTASYIASWINALSNDYTLIVSASSKAQKAADLILGSNVSEDKGEE